MVYNIIPFFLVISINEMRTSSQLLKKESLCVCVGGMWGCVAGEGAGVYGYVWGCVCCFVFVFVLFLFYFVLFCFVLFCFVFPIHV